MKASAHALWAAGAAIVVVAAIVAGLVLIGPPSQERLRTMDARRVSDLQAAALAVDRYWNRHQALPQSLDALARERGEVFTVRDPGSGLPYEYHGNADRSYTLCAAFALGSAGNEPVQGRFWAHGQGRQCFSLEARSGR